jgi:hypothetical protein
VRPSGEITTSVAGVVVDAEDFRPCRAAVFRAKQTALGIRSKEMSDRGDEHGVGVARVDHDASDRLRLSKSHVAPRRAAVE